jgi:hypothetical protein
MIMNIVEFKKSLTYFHINTVLLLLFMANTILESI